MYFPTYGLILYKMTMKMQRSTLRSLAQKSSEPEMMTNAHSCMLAVVDAIAVTSWACAESSWVVKLSKTASFAAEMRVVA